jgi:hypothetical protein
VFEPIKLEADIKIDEETPELRKMMASVIAFPENKTPDLMFFSGIFVSSGENLNHAYFMPSEMVKAANTISNKAIDIEHEESSIVGHIFSSKFIDRDGAELDLKKLTSMNEDQLNVMELDIIIGGILYRSRFPELSKEISKGEWKLSMETYFQDYDIKIGEVVMSRKEAEALGYANEIIGKLAKILKKGKEIAKGEVSRVLRDLLFSGCGVVKNPANPRSIILETAKKQTDKDEGAEIVIDLDKLDGTQLDDNLVAEEKVKDDIGKKKEEEEEADIDIVDIRKNTSVGICVSFKKRIIDATHEGPDSKVIHENWCTLYDKSCTSSSRDVTDPSCLRRQAAKKAKNYVESKLKELRSRDKRSTLLSELELVLRDVKK